MSYFGLEAEAFVEIKSCLRSAVRMVLRRPRYFEDTGQSWNEALLSGHSYDNPEILRKVTDSAAKVLRGQAAFERDSHAFKEPAYSWPLATYLALAAASNRGHLNVLDIGGSLASTYLQYLALWRPPVKVTWTIVEQKAFVDAGSRLFTFTNLRFFESIDEALANTAPNFIYFGSSLQYFEKPIETLKAISGTQATTLYLDRIPIIAKGRGRISVQHVPSEIYTASYPCWLFSLDEVEQILRPDWVLGPTLPNFGLPVYTNSGALVRWSSFVAERNKGI